jgi:hypothetical protein
VFANGHVVHGARHGLHIHAQFEAFGHGDEDGIFRIAEIEVEPGLGDIRLAMGAPGESQLMGSCVQPLCEYLPKKAMADDEALAVMFEPEPFRTGKLFLVEQFTEPVQLGHLFVQFGEPQI